MNEHHEELISSFYSMVLYVKKHYKYTLLRQQTCLGISDDRVLVLTSVSF